ncbi:MAG: hypothetical protein CM15mP46_2240 [Alphaproteobacteria bacterium]|nr:MAG: hypothetical protein CM15mP46_2240 [Alphaproteobacteria bacterium]
MHPAQKKHTGYLEIVSVKIVIHHPVLSGNYRDFWPTGIVNKFCHDRGPFLSKKWLPAFFPPLGFGQACYLKTFLALNAPHRSWAKFTVESFGIRPLNNIKRIHSAIRCQKRQYLLGEYQPAAD